LNTEPAPPHADIVDVPGNPRPHGAQAIWFKSARDRRLRACVCPALPGVSPRGTVIVSPGRTEFIEKYFEVARDLQKRSFAVLILDWPGQGLSERLLSNARKGHIDNFETFMNALARGLDRLGEQLPRPYVSLSHSMGGAISLAAILEKKVEVAAAAFCAPMWGIRTPIRGMRYLVWAMRVMGRGKTFAQRDHKPETFERNLVTHDRRRWEIHDALIRAQPDLGLGPVTWGWLGAAIDIMDAFVRDERLRTLDIPVFVASAERERIVENDRHDRVVALLPDVEHITVAGAYHEILMETDERRAVFWKGFDRLLERAGI